MDTDEYVDVLIASLQPRSQGLSFRRDPGCGWSRASQILGGKLNYTMGRVGEECVCRILRIATLGDEI
jgi:hypothetical protein